MPSELTPDQRALADYMSDLSEEAWCAGWMSGLEYDLWEAVVGVRKSYGCMSLSEEEIGRLRDLSRRCGGWIYFDDETWQTWVPLDEWRRRFAASKRQGRSDPLAAPGEGREGATGAGEDQAAASSDDPAGAGGSGPVPGVVHRHEFQVDVALIDANGHVNNVEFVRWMQEAAVRHADAAGCTSATRESGATWVVRSHHVEYLRPALAVDLVRVLTWVADFRRAFSLRRYRFQRASDGVVLANGETDWAFVDARSGRPRSVPPDIQGLFRLPPAGWEPEGARAGPR